MGDDNTVWEDIQETICILLESDQGILSDSERNRLARYLEIHHLERESRISTVDRLLGDLDRILNQRGYALSPWTIFLVLMCAALVGGILTLNQYSGKVLVTIRNAGCPEFLVGEGLSRRSRGNIQDMGIILPDSVPPDGQEEFSLPFIPVSISLMVAEESDLHVKIIDTTLVLPFPEEVDRIFFNGGDVMQGPITYRIDQLGQHEIILICP
jgi:hypothetical protein